MRGGGGDICPKYPMLDPPLIFNTVYVTGSSHIEKKWPPNQLLCWYNGASSIMLAHQLQQCMLEKKINLL